MRRYLTTLSILMLLFAMLPFHISAASMEDITRGWDNKQNELSQFESKLGTELGIADYHKPYYDKAYIVYYLNDWDRLSDHYNKAGNFNELITDYYTWKVPAEGDYLLTVRKIDEDNWTITEVIMPVQTVDRPWNLIIDKQKVASIISQKGDKITDLKYIESNFYRVTFVYFTADGKEYLIPFSARPDFSGLENGKIYEPAEAISTLEKNIGIPSVQKGDPVYGGGAGTQAEPNGINNVIIIIVSAAGVLVVTGVIVFLIKRRIAKR